MKFDISGTVQLVIDGDGRNPTLMFLDDKPQRIDIDSKPHIFRFVEQFRTLLINGHPFKADFGGQPMVVYVKNIKHYLRLTSLPRGIEPGRPMPTPEEVFRVKPDSLPVPEPEEDPQDGTGTGTNLDRFLNVLPSPSIPKPEITYDNKKVPMEMEPEVEDEKPETNSTPEVDVTQLWASLVGAGLIKKEGSNGGIPGLENIGKPEVAKMEVDDTPKKAEPETVKPEIEVKKPLVQQQIKFEPKIKKIRPVLLESRHSTIKE